MFWPSKVSVFSTFTVRDYVPRKRKSENGSTGKRVTISDTHQVKEISVISYSSTEEEWEPASASSEELFDPTGLVAETSDDLLALIEDYMDGPEVLDVSEEPDEQTELELGSDERHAMEAAGLPTAFGSAEPVVPKIRPSSIAEPRKKKNKRPRCQNSSEIYSTAEVLAQQNGDHTVFSSSSENDSEDKSLLETPKEWGHDQVMAKYWRQRYSLWSRYDEGIWMDTVGWYSVTPEPIAAHIAKRCTVYDETLLIWDPFGGLGGNAIQFALHGHHVICSDINAERLAMAKHNAKIYGVEDFVDFILGDFFQVAGSVKADLVFLSPPWGGPAYLQAESFDVGTMMDINGQLVLDKALQAASNIVYFLPKNSSLESIARLFSQKSGTTFEVEENFLDSRLKSVSVYYGPMFNVPA